MPLKQPVIALIFDWGDTIMRDFNLPGPMSGWKNVACIPGVEKVLGVLSEKYICAIATSAEHSGTNEMIAALKRVGAEKFFHHFFSSEQLGYKKPDPVFFSTITQTLGLATDKCVMIGNLYEKDIIGAKKAGLQTVLFDEKKQNIASPDADMVIHHFEELLKILT